MFVLLVPSEFVPGMTKYQGDFVWYVFTFLTKKKLTTDTFNLFMTKKQNEILSFFIYYLQRHYFKQQIPMLSNRRKETPTQSARQ